MVPYSKCPVRAVQMYGEACSTNALILNLCTRWPCAPAEARQGYSWMGPTVGQDSSDKTVACVRNTVAVPQ